MPHLIALADGCYSDLQHLRSLIDLQLSLVDRAISATAGLRNKLASGSISSSISLTEAASAVQSVQAVQNQLQYAFFSPPPPFPPSPPEPLFALSQVVGFKLFWASELEYDAAAASVRSAAAAAPIRSGTAVNGACDATAAAAAAADDDGHAAGGPLARVRDAVSVSSASGCTVATCAGRLRRGGRCARRPWRRSCSCSCSCSCSSGRRAARRVARRAARRRDTHHAPSRAWRVPQRRAAGASSARADAAHGGRGASATRAHVGGSPACALARLEPAARDGPTLAVMRSRKWRRSLAERQHVRETIGPEDGSLQGFSGRRRRICRARWS